MSDSSGFSGFPPKITGADSYPQSMGELKAKIIAIRGEARVQNVREKMEGEIIRNNRDGTTDIKTPRGEITIELPVKDKPPEGTQILLEVPKGEPPRHVVIREVRTEPQSQVREPSNSEPQAKPARTDSVKITPETSLSLSNQSAAERPASTQAPSVPPLRNGDFVRLTPLPQYEAILPLQENVRQVVEQIVARAEVAAFQTVQNLVAEVIAQPNPQTTNNVAAAPAQALSPQLQPQVISPTFTVNTTQLPQQTLEILPASVLSTTQNAFVLPPALEVFPSLTLPQVVSETASLIARNIQTFQSVPPLAMLQKAIPAVQNILTQVTDQQSSVTKSTAKTFDVQINTIFPPPVAMTTIGGVQPQTGAEAQQPNLVPSMPQLQGIESLLTQTTPVVSKAIVAGQTAIGQPVLSVFMPQEQSWQSFTIPVQPQNLNMGIQMEIMPHIPAQAASVGSMMTAVLPPFIPYEFFSSFSWPAAEEIIQTLQQAAPQAAQMLGQATTTPSLPTRLPAAALLFVAAVRGGDISGWLGDKNIDLLKRLGKGDALNRLTRDLGGIQRTSSESVQSQDWRGMALPMTYDGDLTKLMLYYRHDKTETEDGEKKRGTRFIFDLNLTKMGAVQIDGLHRPINENRLDLIVRTTRPVSDQMRKAMRAVYIEALQQAQAIGDISFQNEKEKFVKVEMSKSAMAL